MNRRTGSGLSNDHIALLLVGGVVSAVAATRSGQLLHSAAHWLQARGLLTPPGAGLVDIPPLGALDLPRVMVLAGLAAATLLAVAAWRRHRRATRARAVG